MSSNGNGKHVVSSDGNRVTPPSPDLSELGGARLIEYGEMAANHIERNGASLLHLMQQQKDECDALAADIRTMCEIQARRSEQIAERSRSLAIAIKEMRDDFVRPLD
jgi:hypothetical protein